MNPFLIFTFLFFSFHLISQDKTLGSIERLDSEINSLISKSAKIEILGSGYTWSEGPLWVKGLNGLLFSDVPENKMYFWSEKTGVKLFLSPSGYTGYAPTSLEKGSNGLTFDLKGNLLLAQPGDRRIAKLNSSLKNVKPNFVTITDNYNGSRFNSPNDVVVSDKNEVFFTDPPYGLKNQDKDPLKELLFNGVYKYYNNEIKVIYKHMSRPNGLALSNDGSKLYVSNSDPLNAIWNVFQINSKNEELSPQVFFDATSMVGKTRKGLPDGLKIHSKGYVFASGPGGILIFNETGKHLGTILTEAATSNCAFNETESYLYMTSDNYLTRIALIN